MRALIGLCLLVTSHWGQIREPWQSQSFIIVHIVIGLSLHIHSFIHLRLYERFLYSNKVLTKYGVSYEVQQGQYKAIKD